MRSALPLLALAATLALSGCGGDAENTAGDGRYSVDVRENFLESCLDNARNATAGRADEQQLTQTCECILGKVEADYSEEEFTQFEQRLLGGTASDAESSRLVTWSNDCSREAAQ